jgi:hypothetical protein
MRLVSAEVLKLVRRRGLMTWALLLAVGSTLLAVVILVALHAANPDRHGPAGGADNLRNLTHLLAGLGTVAAIIVGSTGGSQDVANGVFRDLVVTGRSRSTLFAVRTPGVLLVLLPMVLLAYAIAVADAWLFAGGLPHPTGHELARGLEYTLAATVTNAVLAVGLAAFLSSRVVTGVLIAWNAIVGPLLVAIGSLGGARKAIDTAAIEQFTPDPGAQPSVTMSTAVALAVLLCWVAVAFGAGRWWTERRDA